MQESSMVRGTVLMLALFLVAFASLPTWAQATKEPQAFPPVEFGEPFPGATFKNANPAGPETIDLNAVPTKKPVILYYWIPGNPRADQVFEQLEEAVANAGADKLALYGVAFPRGPRTPYITQGIDKLGVKAPVLLDDGFRLGQQLRVQSVPNITYIDAEGRLRLTNGASMAQQLEFNLTVGSAIDRLAKKGTIGTYGYLARYFPVQELVGKACPDFTAPLLSNSIEQRWSSLMDDEKLNVLIFWSVDCPHCRTSLPELSSYFKENPDGLNVISAARVTNAESRSKTKEFCDLNGFAFRTLVDKDLEISKLYQVTSTPTIVIIGPDGVIDSVILSGDDDVPQTLERKKRELLKKG